MEMVRAAAFAITAAVAAAVLRRMNREAGMALALGAGVMLMGVALTRLGGVAQALQELCARANVQPLYVRTMMKVVGICLLTELASSVCRDAEETGLAERVETVGRALVMAIAAPVLLHLLDQLLVFTA